MDETARQRWNSKLEQHRAVRSKLIDPNSHPSRVYTAVTEYNGALLEEWMNFFKESWERLSPVFADREAASAKREIEGFIQEEEEKINELIENAFRGNAAFKGQNFTNAILNGRAALRQSCEVLKYKAFSVIDNKRAERKGRIKADFRGYVELGLAVFGAILLWKQNGIAQRQVEIQLKQEAAIEAKDVAEREIAATQLRHQVMEILEVYPAHGSPILPKHQPWDRKALFAKFEDRLKAEESNPVLARNAPALEHWRKAVNLSREIQTDRGWQDNKVFQRCATDLRRELEAVLEAL